MAIHNPVGWVDIRYRSPYAFHNMRVNSCQLFGSFTDAVFDPGDGAPTIPVADGVGDLIDVLKTLYTSGTTFIDYTAWSHNSPGLVPIAVSTGSIGVAGTNVADHMTDKATQVTWVWKTAAFHVAKLTMLDYPVGGFDAVSSLTGFTEGIALDAYVTDPLNWVRGADGFVPVAFQQISQTLNEKSRRAYGMV